MKYIIKRILIGTGIAVALMLLTRTFNLSVYASQTNILTPDKLRMTYYQNNLTTTEYNISNLSISSFPSVPFYGKSSTGNNISIRQLRYHTTVQGLKSGYYDISFLSYFGGLNSSYLNGINYSIHQEYAWYSCETSTDLIPVTGQTGLVSGYEPYVQSVVCRNVYIDTSNPNMYVFVNLSNQTNDGSGYGLTTINALYNSNNNNDTIVDNQETIIEQQQEQTQKQQETNDILNDDDTTDAQSSGSSFFNNFSSTDHGGLSGIITTPLSYIQSLASPGSCEPISLKLPFMEDRASLPCLQASIMSMGGQGYNFLHLFHIITDGLIAYYVLVKIFAHIRSFKKPDEDRVEVLEL